MSTSATYLIATDSDQMICFYTSGKGCITDTAHYFYNMLLCKNEKSGYAGQFIRGNEEAEFTEAHEVHLDTTYRYTLDEDGQLKAWRKLETTEWRLFYQGTLYEFITLYHEFTFDRI